eukprot:COSAG01_NODE_11021_length_2025_cov_19.414313_4_plen_149_part_00
MGGVAAAASFLAAVLTEIYLCNVCSCQQILRRNGRGQHVDRPPPGAGLEQWKVEASGLAKGDLRQLSHGTVISFSPPDDYCVEWSDGSTTCYGYSHLFSAGRLPLVLPVPPAQWASYEAAPLEASTQQSVRGCSCAPNAPTREQLHTQ